MLKKNKLLFTTTLIFNAFTVFMVLYFNYLSSLSYDKINLTSPNALALVFQNMYKNTWWSLIILCFIIISILFIFALIYKNRKYLTAIILLLVYLFLITIDFNESILMNLSNLLIFGPLIFITYLNKLKIEKLN